MIIATVSAQRSGTKMLSSMMSSGTQILTLGEVFNPDNETPFSFLTYIKSIGMNKIFEMGSELILSKYFKGILSITGCVHVDILYNQLEYCCVSWNPFSYPFIFDYLKSRKAFIISLRRPAIQRYTSIKVLEQSGVAHFHERGQEVFDKIQLNLSKNELQSFTLDQKKYEKLVDISFSNYIPYYNIDFDTIKAGVIPEDLKQKISDAALAIGEYIDPKKIQMGGPSTIATPIDRAFHWTK
ncbi:MAG: hypothetical protein KGK11_02720 [Sphingomonadales bacterium]|nr:hypothetical protein [Sphingomonadales bacterium]